MTLYSDIIFKKKIEDGVIYTDSDGRLVEDLVINGYPPEVMIFPPRFVEKYHILLREIEIDKVLDD